MSVLVSAASKHGGTVGIAEKIAEVLRSRGLEVRVAAPSEVDDLDGHAAVVLGSGVYAGHWLADAKELAHRIGAMTSPPRVWIFSSGPVGDPPRPEEDPVDVSEMMEETSALEHRIFAGVIDKSLLGFAERAMVAALHVPEGDFRDWPEITNWAHTIADGLAPGGQA